MKLRWFLICCCWLLNSCVTPALDGDVLLTPPLTATPSPWETLLPGLELRTYYPRPDNDASKIVALRIDPASFTFRVHYRPGDPILAQLWVGELPRAVAFINANFFTESAEVLGLLVSNSVVYGTPYTDRGGTFLVQNGQPRIRSNVREPYLGEAMEQAVQAFPMLVQDRLQAYTSTAPDRFTRRTVIAQDSVGRIILMVTPLFGLPLLDLSAYLPQTDMDIVNAFNLDGGGSTMMAVARDGVLQYVVTSPDPVPSVLAVYPR